MTVESKIVFRSDSSEVRRSIADLKAAKTAMAVLGGEPGAAVKPSASPRAAKGPRAPDPAKEAAAKVKADARALAQREKSEAASVKKAARERASAEKAAQRDYMASQKGAFSGMSLTDLKSGFDIVSGIAMKIGSVIYQAGSAVIEAQAFKEDVTRGLETVLHSKIEAQKVLDLAASTADFIGQGRADVSGQMLALLAKGFDKGKADEIVRRFADLTTVTPDANLQGLTKALTDIRGKGKLAGQEVLQFANAGLSANAVYDALAEQLHKSRAEIQKMQEAGAITADMATEGILAAVGKLAGGKAAGEAARAKAREDLNGLLTQIKNIPSNLLFDMDAGPGIEKTKASLRAIIDFFDSTQASGKEVRQVLGDTFNAFAEGLFGIDTSKGTGIKDTLKAIVEAVKNSKEDIKDFGSALRIIGGSIAWVAGIGASVSGFWSKWGTWIEIAMFPLFVLKLAIQGVIYAWDALPGAWSAMVGFFAGIGASISSFASDMWAAGGALIDGLIGGIGAKVGGVWAAAKGAAQSAVDAVKSLWQVASPSRVAHKLGVYYDQGLGGGIAANDHAGQAAGASAQSAVGATTAGLGAAVQGGSSGGGSVYTYAPVYQIAAGVGAKEIDAIRDIEAHGYVQWRRHAQMYYAEEANVGQ